LILRKIGEIGATRCQILRLKCTKFDFRWGSAPDPAGGAYSALPDPLVVFKGPTCKGREGKMGRGRKGKGRLGEGSEKREGGEGKEDSGREWREERGWEHAPISIFKSRRLFYIVTQNIDSVSCLIWQIHTHTHTHQELISCTCRIVC